MIWLFLSGWVAFALLLSFVLWCACRLNDRWEEDDG